MLEAHSIQFHNSSIVWRDDARCVANMNYIKQTFDNDENDENDNNGGDICHNDTEKVDHC